MSAITLVRTSSGTPASLPAFMPSSIDSVVETSGSSSLRQPASVAPASRAAADRAAIAVVWFMAIG